MLDKTYVPKRKKAPQSGAFVMPSAFVYADRAAAIEHCGDYQQAAGIDAKIDRFVASAVAAATHKQSNEYHPGAVATVAAVVVEQTVEHNKYNLPKDKKSYFSLSVKNVFTIHIMAAGAKVLLAANRLT